MPRWDAGPLGRGAGLCLITAHVEESSTALASGEESVHAKPRLEARTPVVTPSVFPGLSAAQRKFAHSLRDFKFEFIGDAETDDERCIGA